MRTSDSLHAGEMDVHGAVAAPTPLLTKKQVADWLSISLRTVDAMIASGELRPFHIRGVRRFATTDVLSYLERSVADK